MAYMRYDELGSNPKIDYNISSLTNLPLPEYWDNPLRENRIDTVHLSGIYPSNDSTYILETQLVPDTLRFFPSCDLNSNPTIKKYWAPCMSGACSFSQGTDDPSSKPQIPPSAPGPMAHH